MNKTRSKTDTLRKRIAPGIWEDENGNIHWSIPELLEIADIPDTPEHRAIMTAMLKKLLRKNLPNAAIIYRENPPKYE